MNDKVQHVFIAGAKNIGSYGGYETFVAKLIEYHQNQDDIMYHIACKASGTDRMDETSLENVTVTQYDQKGKATEFLYRGAHCVKIRVPNIGPAQAIYYDIASLRWFCKYIKEQHISHPIIYILACRIGPFIQTFWNKIHKLGGKVYINPDGHEWMRAKWSAPIRKYWKYSERQMVRYCDLVVCDSVHIEKYIHECYDGKEINGGNPKTTYIAYGAEITDRQALPNETVLDAWLSDKALQRKEYYLVVGRFVPENNYKTIIREFMCSNSKKTLVIVTHVNEKFLAELERKLHYQKDERIRFVGTVYDQALLTAIRANAYGYLHGHEVGGTNPSLLEALATTDLNLLLDVCFNREVAQESAIYWTKDPGNLAQQIEKCDCMGDAEMMQYSLSAKRRIKEQYSWQRISSQYRSIFSPDKLVRAEEAETNVQ